MKKNTLFIILIIGIALIIGIWRDHQENEVSANAFLSVGTALQQPYKLPDFSFTDMNNRPFTNDAFKTHWTFLFFGYSQCPQICPATLYSMKQISDKLGQNANTQFVFVSIDPEYDTPQTLKAFLQEAKLMPSIIGLTGNKASINNLAQHLGIHIAKEGKQDASAIEHSGSILLINPEGKLIAVFSAPDKTNAIVKDFKEIVHHYVNA